MSQIKANLLLNKLFEYGMLLLVVACNVYGVTEKHRLDQWISTLLIKRGVFHDGLTKNLMINAYYCLCSCCETLMANAVNSFYAFAI